MIMIIILNFDLARSVPILLVITQNDSIAITVPKKLVITQIKLSTRADIKCVRTKTVLFVARLKITSHIIEVRSADKNFFRSMENT